jgi:AmmeMemoRadiSam system protein B
MGVIRPPAVAGTFYPADPEVLRRTVAGLLDGAGVGRPDLDVRMIIVPHAALRYSGPIAATGYAAVAGRTASIRRVVLIGPSHFVPFDGLAAPGADAMTTPLGDVAVDDDLARRADRKGRVRDLPEAHGPEHDLEVQLPFLQIVLPGRPVLPLLTGRIAATEAADVLHTLVDDDVLTVVSSDLSHYLDDASARERDGRTAQAIVELRDGDVWPGDACGQAAVQAALIVARRRGWSCTMLDLGNSSDTVGDPDRVVGYGAFALGR